LALASDAICFNCPSVLIFSSIDSLSPDHRLFTLAS